MTGWLFHDAWSPALVVLAGLATAGALAGVGLLALEVVGIDLPAAWRAPAGILLGIEIQALDVQILGWTRAATRPVLIIGWCVYAVVGLLYLWSIRPRVRAQPARLPRLLIFAAIAALSTLLVAAAPSTKIDEIYYHMLLPSRLVTDGALWFYRYPWEGAAWPQMIFQLSSAPLHALGVPDGPNVVSWFLSVVLLWSAWRMANDLTRRTALPALLVASIAIGTYPAVWWTTGGAHVMGDLALACAVAAVCAPDLLRARVPPRTYTFAVALFALAAATTKISLLPLGMGLTAVGVVQAWRDGAGQRPGAAVTAALAPWAVFYLPVVIATWIASGAPFGPFEAWIFPTTVYDPAHIHRIMDVVHRAGQRPFQSTPWELLARRTPLLWLAALGALLASTLPGRSRVLAAAILLAQGAAIVALLPWDPRFLSGIPIALAILFARYPGPRVAAWLDRPRVASALVVVLAVPWLGAQLWYSAAFARVSTGLTSAEAFRTRFVPFWRDFAPLDSVLPRDAVLLVDGYRLGAVYAPRAIVWTAADIRGLPSVYQFGPACAVTNPSFAAGPVLYLDPAAVVEAPRDPRRAQTRGPLCVRRLERH